jgi:transcription termination factor Rho
MTVEHLNLADLKAKTPAELLTMAEEWEIENAPSMRKGEMMFSILKEHAEEGWEIGGDGVLEVVQDGFGFLRSTAANYLAGPDDIYVSPEILRQFSLRTGDTIEGLMQAPRDGERYFSITKVTRINFDDPEKARHKVLFDNLTPLYPDERLKMEVEDPTIKDKSADRQGPTGADRGAAADW